MVNMEDIRKYLENPKELNLFLDNIKKDNKHFFDHYSFIFDSKNDLDDFMHDKFLNFIEKYKGSFDTINQSLEDAFYKYLTDEILDIFIKTIKNQDGTLIDKFINQNFLINQKNKYKNILDVANLLDKINLSTDFFAVNAVIQNEIFIKNMKEQFNNEKINLDRIPEKYKTNTFLFILQLYCDKNNIKLMEDEFSDEELAKIDDSYTSANIDDSFALFTRDMKKYTIPSEEEVSLLAKKIKEGDEQSKNELALRNWRLSVSIAKKFIGHGIPFIDLIQEGMLGLIKAAEKYDIDKGFRFSTYATWWVRQAVAKYVHDMANTIRIPVHMHERLSKFKKINTDFIENNGRKPTTKELSKLMNLPEKEISFLYDVYSASNISSLNAPISDEEDSELERFIADKFQDVEEQVLSEQMIKEILDILADSDFKDKERDIVCLRLGINGDAKILQEVGDLYGLTRERVRQIEAKALVRFKRRLEKKEFIPLDANKVEIKEPKYIDEFMLEPNMNKFDTSRLLPRFSDGTLMSTWYVSEDLALSNSLDKRCKEIIRQRNEVKKIKEQTGKMPEEGQIKIIIPEDTVDKSNIKNNFYSEFPEYKKEDIDRAFGMLGYSNQEAVLKKYDGDLNNNINNNYKTLEYIEQKLYYDAKKRIRKLIDNNFCTYMKQEIQEKKSIGEPNNFYSELPDYKKEDIDKAFELLSDTYKNAVLKKHDGNLSNNKNLNKAILTGYESIYYSTAKKRIKELIENDFVVKKKGKKKMEIEKNEEKMEEKIEEGVLVLQPVNQKTPVEISNPGEEELTVITKDSNESEDLSDNKEELKLNEGVTLSDLEETLVDTSEAKDNFYSEFPEYEKEDIDKVFKTLGKKAQNAILKKYDGNLSNQKNTKRGYLDKNEIWLLSTSKKKIKEQLEKSITKEKEDSIIVEKKDEEALDDVEIVDKKEKNKDKTKKDFYSEFEGYKKEDVDKAFQLLGKKTKSAILKKCDGNLSNTINDTKGLLTTSETRIYYNGKIRIQELINNNFNFRTSKSKKENVEQENIPNEIIEEKKEDKIDLKESYEEAIQDDIDEKVEEKLIDETFDNEHYLKAYEILNSSYIRNFIYKKEYFNILFMRINFPNKSIDEIAKFIGVSKEEVIKVLNISVDDLVSLVKEFLEDTLINYGDSINIEDYSKKYSILDKE